MDVAKHKVMTWLFIIVIIIVGALLTYGILMGSHDLSDFTAVFTIIIAAMVLYYSQVVIVEEIELFKENVEATFFGDVLSSGMFRRGKLRFSLIFYNKGDRMSVLKINKIMIPNHDLKSNKLELLYSILPNSHQLVKIDDQMLERDDYIEFKSLKIDSMVIEYSWTKKGKIIDVKDDEILVKCIIKEVPIIPPILK